jgi:glycosyltransferase involved in cell wall biosynthesis
VHYDKDMTILFLTDNFPPEFNAPATRTFEHCREWVAAGHKVIVITCFPNFPMGKVYEGYKNKLYSKEEVEGINVIRVWTFIAPNKGMIKRSLDFLSFAFSSFVVGLFIKCDVIVATSPQFFTALSGYFLSLFKRKKWIMEVRDLWPESIQAVDAIQTSFVIRCLEKLELFLYRKASRLIVVTDSFKENIVSRGILPAKILVIKNGVDTSRFQPRNKNQEILRQLNLQRGFIIGYIGTHGLAHGLDFIVRSAKKIQDSDIHFLFIGDGAEKNNLIRRTKELGLENFTFLPPVPKNQVPDYLSVLDVALVPLRKSSTFENVIPSKIFETAAMNKPIFLGLRGETQKIIELYHAGICFEPEDETDFLEKLSVLKHNITTGQVNYTEGCRSLARDYDRRKLAHDMLNIIINLAPAGAK